MSREALGIWRGSYEASVTGGRENRRAMLMVTREYSGLRQLSEMDDGADAADADVQGLLDEKKWCRCSRCLVIVERTAGCDHITCKCGHEFCYQCGVPSRRQTCPGRGRAH